RRTGSRRNRASPPSRGRAPPPMQIAGRGQPSFDGPGFACCSSRPPGSTVWCPDPPEPPLPRGIVFEHPQKNLLVEIRPVFIDEGELRIGALPDQEIREPPLAAGPDDKVRIRRPGRVKGARDSCLGD